MQQERDNAEDALATHSHMHAYIIMTEHEGVWGNSARSLHLKIYTTV